MKRLAPLLLLAVIVACSHVTSGEVVDKRHEDQRIYWDQEPIYGTVPVQQCTGGYGATRSCTTTYRQQITGYMPVQRIDDEDWILVLRDQDDKQGEVRVSEETYNRMEIGSWYGGKDEQ